MTRLRRSDLSRPGLSRVGAGKGFFYRDADGERITDETTIARIEGLLLDLGFFRLGSEGYAAENETYGVATLEQRHVQVDDDQLVFDYAAKGGKRRVQVIADHEVVEVVERLKKRRGSKNRLLAYKDGRSWRELHPSDVNDYLKEHAGACSAKDFRTWNGTVLAALGVAVKADDDLGERERDRVVSDTVEEVAYFLGNTPAVARASYVDPRVFDRFDDGWTIAARVAELGGPEAFVDPEGRIALEDAVRDLLRDAGDDSPALERVDG